MMTVPTTQYTAAAKLLHWLMAAAIIGLLCIGTGMVFLPKGDLRGLIYDYHKQLGVVALILATSWILALANTSTSGGRGLAGDWPVWLLTGITTLVVWRTKLHLLWLLGAGAVLGALGFL